MRIHSSLRRLQFLLSQTSRVFLYQRFAMVYAVVATVLLTVGFQLLLDLRSTESPSWTSTQVVGLLLIAAAFCLYGVVASVEAFADFVRESQRGPTSVRQRLILFASSERRTELWATWIALGGAFSLTLTSIVVSTIWGLP